MADTAGSHAGLLEHHDASFLHRSYALLANPLVFFFQGMQHLLASLAISLETGTPPSQLESTLPDQQ